MTHVRELVEKGVLKGADRDAPAYVYRPKHAGKLGEPVILVTADDGPVWYSSRMVRDEYVRQRRGESTRFDSADNQPSRSPKGGIGDGFGDGPSTSSSPSGSEAKASAAAGASAAVDKSTNPEPPAVDRRWLWETAKAILVEAGTSEQSAREFMGALVKDWTEAVAFKAVSAAAAADPKPIDPKGWLIATCKAIKATPSGGQYESAEQTSARLAAEAERHAAQDPAKTAEGVAAAKEASQRIKSEKATGVTA